jgi:hypothetical protein
MSGMCNREKLREAASPDKKYVAAVFVGGCGATTGFSYGVTVRPASEPFSTDFEHNEDGGLFFTSEGLLEVSWKGEKTLTINCEGCPANKVQGDKVSAWRDVGIEYEFRERRPEADGSGRDRK